MDPSDDTRPAVVVMTGRERLRLFKEGLENFNRQRQDHVSAEQRWFHREMTKAVMRRLGIDDYADAVEVDRSTDPDTPCVRWMDVSVCNEIVDAAVARSTNSDAQ